jgi:L-histidine N-alpha-methyltransferase
LRDAAVDIAERLPGVQVHGVVGDFHEHVQMLPTDGVPVLAFLGSTIGNFYPDERQRFLAEVADWLPAGGWFLLGFDLVKDIGRLMDAYNDPAGLTAEFTLNLLDVLNRELSADFDTSAFEHVGMWDPTHTRVDLRLRARRPQHVRLPAAGIDVDFEEGEELQVEISTKFTLEQVDAELRAARLELTNCWTDRRADVAVVLARGGVSSRDPAGTP